MALKKSEESRALINLADYERCFQVFGTPFLQSEIYADYYKNLDAIFVFKDTKWTSYVSNRAMNDARSEGKILFEQEYLAYKDSFHEFLNDAAKTMLATVSAAYIQKKDAERFLDLLKKFFHFYEKTEFYYTDAIVHAPQDFGALKNEAREYLNGLFFGRNALLNRFLRIVAKQFDIKNEAVLNQYSCGELLSHFDGGKVSDGILNKRKESYIMIAKDNEVIFADDLSVLIVGASKSPLADTFSGIVAHPGKVRGCAVIAEMSHDHYDGLAKISQKMKKGDILVAETTSPEFIACVRKAGAIITNQGGLLSHAAIVSREMKIPCIVGTKIATQVLKDGDLVEVDADRGAVRVLKGANS